MKAKTIKINGAEVSFGLDDQWLGHSEVIEGSDGPIEFGGTFEAQLDPGEAAAFFDAVQRFAIEHSITHGKPPLVEVPRYSVADAMLAQALATGELIGGDVAEAYSWTGAMVVSYLMPDLGGDMVTYALDEGFGRVAP